MGLTFPLNVTMEAIVSYQTGLSASISTALAPVNIGSAISILNNGIVKIGVSGHVSADVGGIRILRTRNGITDIIDQDVNGDSTTSQGGSLFTDGSNTLVANSNGFSVTTRHRLLKALSLNATSPSPLVSGFLELDVLNGDSLQFQVTNSTASTIVYIDDLLVIQ